MNAEMGKTTTVWVRRISAGVLDFVLIGIYAGVVCLLVTRFGLDESINRFVAGAPARGQFVGFMVLTLPVVLYFVLLEKSPHGATLGKRILGLRVHVDAPNQSVGSAILTRNVLKFLPWEVAHFGVHQLLTVESAESETPIWVWTALILPQIAVFIYFISMLLDKKGKSVYDRIAGTRVWVC